MSDNYFDGVMSEVTSGKRTAIEQLAIIIDAAERYHIEKEFPEFDCRDHLVVPNEPELQWDFKVDVGNGEQLDWWHRTWSRLLNLGFIVNPPKPAIVLFDYVNPMTKENKKGKLIDISTHQKGLAWDIGGGTDLTEKVLRVIRAYKSGDCYIQSYTIEKGDRSK
jgi:hypothetical protein